MATATRTRKPATSKPVAAVTDPAPAVPNFTTSKATKPEKRKELFRFNDEPFTVPETIGPRIVYLGMDKVRSEGSSFAVMYLVELLLGADQYAKLLAHYERHELSEPDFDKMIGLVSDLFFTRVNTAPNEEAAEGKDDSASASTTS
jgi:hypothetical protein